MDQALANRPYEVAGAKKHQRRLQPHRPLSTISSRSDPSGKPNAPGAAS